MWGNPLARVMGRGSDITKTDDRSALVGLTDLSSVGQSEQTALDTCGYCKGRGCRTRVNRPDHLSTLGQIA